MRFRTWRFFTMDAFRILRKTLPRHHLQPSICRSALLYTLRIPSYLFKGSPILLSWFYAFIPTNGSFQFCRLNKVRSFPIGIHALGTTTSADFSRQALLHHGNGKLYSIMVLRMIHLHHMSVRPPRIRVLTFHLMSAPFTPTVPNSYRALVCLATLPTVICLI